MTSPSPSPSDQQSSSRHNHGLRRDSSEVSLRPNEHIQWDSTVLEDDDRGLEDHDSLWENRISRRRSSLNLRIATLRQMGGVNSIDNFANSITRAAKFHEITPVRPPFRFEDDGEEEAENYSRKQSDSYVPSGSSLLRQAFQDPGRVSPTIAQPAHDAHLVSEQTPLIRHASPSRIDNLFSIEPSLASGYGASFGTHYSSHRRSSIPVRPNLNEIFRDEQQNIKSVEAEASEQDPLIIKHIEEDGVKFTVVVGQSTVYQTIFNSVNVLIGVGLLSLPLGLLYSGWIVGLLFMTFAALATQYTAKLLAKCLDVDNSLITFADLAFVSFGRNARIATSVLFSIELIAACVALVILFADSLNALIPNVDVITWKIVCGFILIPLTFLPLWVLSFTSILGILCCISIFLVVLTDGLIKPNTPGSLREPASTYLFPKNWQTIPIAFGLLMSPWGGHSVFPNIYRDMRHPYKYRKAVDTTYLFTFALDMGMAIIGLLMFGDAVSDEITSNILLTKGYPPLFNYVVVVCIAIVPLTKVPLNARPIVATVEVLTGLLDPARPPDQAGGLVKAARAAVRVACIVLFVYISIIFPAFDRIMTLLGAVCCFSICIVLPIAFHLKLFGKEMTYRDKLLDWVLLIVSSIMAIVSTVFACMPREFLNGK